MRFSLLLLLILLSSILPAQESPDANSEEDHIRTLIAQYSQARETRDTVLLKKILTSDIDQLVSSGVWRKGIQTAIDGMQRSSSNNPGTRTLTVENIRLLTAEHAIVDCRYVIKNPNGNKRRMWSTFFVVLQEGQWKITAIRNMLPARRN